ncbi:regulatory ArsR family protein [Krasilnikovia cinnamomea]|uniref:Regulatory ArsR family protein n=1 Tax=Krasilnikovia cinnamomea TaxID=349313 RepID=A0A4Q7ZI16_9ACTN|nr:winged helix-turn-helix domain-containing protein [Krasilnikovia cinnamomea]RZU50084.1 regulatory ArsR family protein [Krasilnikovia cinnamomea]
MTTEDVGMTGDVRDRILELLSSGPATVAGLATRLDLPGGVVSYQLKLLEQAGLVWVGASRTVRGVPTPVYVSTAAAVPPPLAAPAPLPGLTWTGTGRFPAPVWTTDLPADAPTGSMSPASERGGNLVPEPEVAGAGSAIPDPRRSNPRRPDPFPPRVDVRRVPLDDATFAEFAARLDALTREFAARAAPGSPAAEVAVTFCRPPGAPALGYGS